MLSITKRFDFCYGHQLPDHEGKCKNVHGHNAVLEVTVTGLLHTDGPSNGMIVDFGILKDIVDRHVVDKLDHQFLNDYLVTSAPPTAEQLVLRITGELIEPFLERDLHLVRVRLYETPDSYAEWTA